MTDTIDQPLDTVEEAPVAQRLDADQLGRVLADIHHQLTGALAPKRTHKHLRAAVRSTLELIEYVAFVDRQARTVAAFTELKTRASAGATHDELLEWAGTLGPDISVSMGAVVWALHDNPELLAHLTGASDDDATAEVTP